MRHLLIFLFFFGVLATSCKAQGVLVKFRNDTGQDIQQLQARFSDTTITLTNIKAGKMSQPVRVSRTFPYFSVSATTGGETLTYIPIDNVGQTELTKGQLTLYLSIVPAGTGKRLELRSSKP